ncbi:MAG: hypothetical protein PHE17_14610 [Thiothrix sp.]|uniref:hypothetical protein n=1 Tax=Thiothrix sp. TaxID=1032 RepID=UPI00261AFECF|nr:hypothetical protein [Thiothrix sp.]MDD5394242.1 hypothetical protein [Thiothrix sp.]
MNNVLVIIAGVIVIVSIVLVAFWLLWSRIGQSGQEVLESRYPLDKPILSDAGAYFVGVESKGRLQLRGNGALALTATELWYKAAFFSTELVIPMQDINHVELVDSHLGKVVFGRKMLKVYFKNINDQADSVAFLVNNESLWRQSLERAKFGK